jgi:hypothetical protein
VERHLAHNALAIIADITTAGDNDEEIQKSIMKMRRN